MKLALGVEYFGSNFHGWQLQKNNIRTIQYEVEKALSKVANHSVRVFCAGRTDAGVHAIEQIIHFETNRKYHIKNWILGGNTYLTNDISFKWAKQVDVNFHARFSAIARQYHYKIHNTKIRPALFAQHLLWVSPTLNVDAMSKACQHLIGEHDFSAFRNNMCQAKSPIKIIEHITINKCQDIITIDIKANAFLHHMVRNIVGTLIIIGKEQKPINWIKEILKNKQRKQAGATAQAQGLYFVKAFY